MWERTCTGDRNQGRHPTPPLTVFLPDVSSSYAHLCWSLLLLRMHCLQGEEEDFHYSNFMVKTSLNHHVNTQHKQLST